MPAKYGSSAVTVDVRRRRLAQAGARGFQQRIPGSELPVQRLVFALQDGCGFRAGLVLLPGHFDVGPQRLQVGLRGEGILEALLDLSEFILRHCRGNLLPGPVVLGDPAQRLQLPGHALVRLFAASRELGGLREFLLQILHLRGHEFQFRGVVEAEDVVLPAGEAVVLLHGVAVALDHAAQAQALVQPGQFVRVLDARVGEVDGDPFTDPLPGVGRRPRW